MIKALMHDPIFFAVKSEPATKDDLQTTQNLLCTLIALKDSRVGIAANMISVKKCIITFLDENGLTPIYTVMLNPEIIKKAVHTTPRMDVYLSSVIQGLANAINPSRLSIKTLKLPTRIKPYTDWTAQIIQHEIDHCDGILI